MKKLLLILLLFITVVPNITAQSEEKIKGNRNVTLRQTYIDDFHSIVVEGDFSIEIVYNSKPSVNVEADDNLHDVIDFNVVDGVLTFIEKMRISSKKKLNITVNYADGLHTIETKGDGEIRSLTSMELEDVTLVTSDNSRAYLNIIARTFDYKSSGKSKTRLNLTADSTRIELSDNSKLDALITSKTSNFDLYQRADAVIDGNTNNSVIRLDNSTNFNGSKFDVKAVDASLEDSSDLTISATESITIASTGDSEIYLYGSPSIIITKFDDTSKLQKKKR
ncbi:GIN domain-containing protein [Winogradskyella sp. 4-2091]|uniref:GIN domain-containing protein n=1 Tax=Winogradskyella sp. 4-2091 TaxID=3381659 RepID=UPI003891ADB3